MRTRYNDKKPKDNPEESKTDSASMETHHKDKKPKDKPGEHAPKDATPPPPQRVRITDNLPKPIIPDPEIEAIPKGPLDLLSTVHGLQFRRCRQVKKRRRRRRRHRERERRERLPAELAQLDAEDAASNEKYRQEQREITYPARELRRIAHAKVKRRLKKPLEKLEREEIWGRIEDAVGEEMEGGRLVKREGEREWEFEERMEKLAKKVEKMGWVEWCKRGLLGNLKYFEGIPLNVVYTQPSIVRILWPSWREQSRMNPCLNCELKGMPCSHTMKDKNGEIQRGSCSRCTRMGDKCVSKHPMMDDDPYNWFINGEMHFGEGDRSAVHELLKRREEMKIKKALPVWQETEIDGVEKEAPNDEKRWWHRLRDKSTKEMAEALRE